MSTSYGSAIVALPGLPPIRFETIDGCLCCRGYHSYPRFLPTRTIISASGAKLRLSRKQRSRLITNSKKWSMSWEERGNGYRYGGSFRTSDVNRGY